MFRLRRVDPLATAPRPARRALAWAAPWPDWIARGGYVAKGALFLLIGGLAAAAAAGWGGDAYALYGRGSDRTLVVRWRWDTPRDAKQFLVALRAWADDGLAGSRRVDVGMWRTDTGAAALSAAGDSVALVLAPDVPVAARTSLAAVRGR